MRDKGTAEGRYILNFENFVTRPMQEQGMVVWHEAASSTRWLLGGDVAHLALKVSQVVSEKQVKNEAPEQTSQGDRKKRGYASGPCEDVFCQTFGCLGNRKPGLRLEPGPKYVRWMNLPSVYQKRRARTDFCLTCFHPKGCFLCVRYK